MTVGELWRRLLSLIHRRRSYRSASASSPLGISLWRHSKT